MLRSFLPESAGLISPDIGPWQANKCSLSCPAVDRFSELENLRRSIAMANPQSWALRREDAMALIRELQAVEGQLRQLRDGLTKLLKETGSPA